MLVLVDMTEMAVANDVNGRCILTCMTGALANSSNALVFDNGIRPHPNL